MSIWMLKPLGLMMLNMPREGKRGRSILCLSNFNKTYPYYEVMKPILGSCIANAPTLMLESTQPDTLPLEEQLGIEMDKDNRYDDEEHDDSGVVISSPQTPRRAREESQNPFNTPSAYTSQDIYNNTPYTSTSTPS
jgi:hypothetical protein